MSSKRQLKTRTSTAVEQELTPDQQIEHLKVALAEAQREVSAGGRDLGHIELLLREIRQAAPAAPAVKIEYRPPKEKLTVTAPCSKVFHISDWHIGRVTLAHQIEEWGEYNYAVACARVAHLCKAMLEDTEMERSNMRMDELYVLATADMILGMLRVPDMATAEWDVCQQVVMAARLVEGLLTGLAPHFSAVHVKWIVTDNHSRLSSKFNHAEPWNNLNYLVAELARAYTVNQPHIDWEVFPGELGIVDIRGTRFLMRHGHDMGKGAGGFGGVPYYEKERAVGLEARRRMHKPREQQPHVLLMGHLHKPMLAADWMIGGALSGTDNFDHSQQRESPPCQTAWVVHPKHRIKHYERYVLA